MPTNRVRLDSWPAFRHLLHDYARQPRIRREQWIFRGQPCASDGLQTTLDRRYSFKTSEERNHTIDDLLNEFRREAFRLELPWANLPNSDGFQLLARHHGLPSPLLDWTESPYIAAFFAFEQADPEQPDPVAIFAIDRSRLPESSEAVELINDIKLLRFNKPALRQRGVFLRVASVATPLDQALSVALTRFEIPARECGLALTDLDEMTINRTFLFESPAAAADTAANRVMYEGDLL